MPIILSAEDPRRPEKINGRTETYSMKVKISHVTVCGLKFLGNPLPNNWHCCLERVGDNLDDFVVSQCMFVGDPNTLAIYCPVIGAGDGLVVEHCVFHKTHACVVFWDGFKGIGQKGCAMRNCIVDEALIAGVWTCQTAVDFDCRRNIVINSQYFWLRKPGDTGKYHIRDCIVANNRFYSGYGVETGPVAQTGPEVEYLETNTAKTGRVLLDYDKNSRNFLHIITGTFGHDIGAGLFKKDKEP
jgi:hypothetical protein